MSTSAYPITAWLTTHLVNCVSAERRSRGSGLVANERRRLQQKRRRVTDNGDVVTVEQNGVQLRHTLAFRGELTERDDRSQQAHTERTRQTQCQDKTAARGESEAHAAFREPKMCNPTDTSVTSSNTMLT